MVVQMSYAESNGRVPSLRNRGRRSSISLIGGVTEAAIVEEVWIGVQIPGHLY